MHCFGEDKVIVQALNYLLHQQKVGEKVQTNIHEFCADEAGLLLIAPPFNRAGRLAQPVEKEQLHADEGDDVVVVFKQESHAGVHTGLVAIILLLRVFVVRPAGAFII